MKHLPRGVVALGFVSLFMDMSSEIAHAVLPLFVVGTLGASAAFLGFLEAAAGLITQVAKLYSGIISDRMRQRKTLALLGYGLAALSKPLFPMASGPWMVFAARMSDRIGKGIRAAPRDAMVADMTTPDQRGAAFGLRQSMDSFGAFAGPLLAVVLAGAFAFDARQLLWVACIPALICVAILAFGVREPERVLNQAKSAPGLSLKTAKALGGKFWIVMFVTGGIMVARVSDAFLVLRGSQVGLGLALIPLVLVVWNGVDALASYPVGQISDKRGRLLPLALSLVALALSMVALGHNDSIVFFWIGIVLFGFHMALSQSVLASFAADAAPAELRGSAFGMLGAVSGLAAFGASIAVGLLWDHWGAKAIFNLMAIVAMAALAVLVFALQPRSSHQ